VPGIADGGRGNARQSSMVGQLSIHEPSHMGRRLAGETAFRFAASKGDDSYGMDIT
jgi:hypothetical protein